MKRQWRSARGRWLRAWDLRACSAGVAALVLAAGCGTLGGLTKDTPPDVKAAAVKERSNARWAALIKGDMDAAYAYLSPGTRETDFVRSNTGGRMRSIGYRAVQIEKVECEAETCNVGLSLTYDYIADQGPDLGKGSHDVACRRRGCWKRVRHGMFAAVGTRSKLQIFHSFRDGALGRHLIRSTKGVGSNNIPVLLVLK